MFKLKKIYYSSNKSIKKLYTKHYSTKNNYYTKQQLEIKSFFDRLSNTYNHIGKNTLISSQLQCGKTYMINNLINIKSTYEKNKAKYIFVSLDLYNLKANYFGQVSNFIIKKICLNKYFNDDKCNNMHILIDLLKCDNTYLIIVFDNIVDVENISKIILKELSILSTCEYINFLQITNLPTGKGGILTDYKSIIDTSYSGMFNKDTHPDHSCYRIYEENSLFLTYPSKCNIDSIILSRNPIGIAKFCYSNYNHRSLKFKKHINLLGFTCGNNLDMIKKLIREIEFENINLDNCVTYYNKTIDALNLDKTSKIIYNTIIYLIYKENKELLNSININNINDINDIYCRKLLPLKLHSNTSTEIYHLAKNKFRNILDDNINLDYIEKIIYSLIRNKLFLLEVEEGVEQGGIVHGQLALHINYPISLHSCKFNSW